MDISRILQQVDTLYGQSKGAEAEKLMLQGINLAVEEQDNESLLQLLNELLGYYRETSQVENSYAIGEQAIGLAEKMGLSDTIPYATTLLNVANAYRAGGRLQESLAYYEKVQGIYEKCLPNGNMLMASLQNNKSLLYQEMDEFEQAKKCLLLALEIVKEKAADFEIAVTYANLANTCMQLQEWEEAFRYGREAIASFENMGVLDFHYGAALSAMGTYYYQKEKYASAKEHFQKASRIMEEALGQNEYYHRLQANIAECERLLGRSAELFRTVEKDGKAVANNSNMHQKGMELCREYYEVYGKPMIEKEFSEYADKIAVGLVGEGSDCFGYDDEISKDHDWGPDFCMWVTEETYQEIGQKLQKAYEQLPTEYKGYRRTVSPQGVGRRGAMTVEDFYQRLLSVTAGEEKQETLFVNTVDWRMTTDAALAAAVNGEVFRDEEGVFTEIRRQLKKGYPEKILYLKLAESAARFSQTGQYNYDRCMKRGDKLTAQIMLADCAREAMKLKHYLEGKYPPHDKWLKCSLEQLTSGKELSELLEKMMKIVNSPKDIIEEISSVLIAELYAKNYISDTDNFLDAHTEELLQKAELASLKDAELLDKIIRLEFSAFDKVENVGGRADCQNDWPTFYVMRKSQYLTWNRTMLMQYAYDFQRELRKGHNLITEKYGRMMESTAPEEYNRIKQHFPYISTEKQAIIQQIVALQVSWMEEFSANYPNLAANARSIHTAEDNLHNTSYETYLRGEISTYSDKMLELYGRYIVTYAQANENLAYEIMQNSAKMYGYNSLEAAEQGMANEK